MFFINLYYDLRYGKIIASALKQSDNVYVGKRHSDCFIQCERGVLRNAEQGFYTEKKKFVNRAKALKIARHYNQIVKKHPPYDQLLSEDIG